MEKGVFNETDILMLRKLETVRQHFQQFDSEFRSFETCFIGMGYSYGGYSIDNRNDFEHLIKGDFIEYKKPIEYPTEFKGQKVYQMSDWKGGFENFKAGDLFTVEFAEWFLDCVPPVCWSRTFVQCGEPYSHQPDKDGNFRPTYTTLEAVKGTINDTGSVWKFCGHCFKGEHEEFRG